MAHKSEFIATKGGFSVKNGSTITPVINQDGTLNGSAVIDDLSVTTNKLAADAVTSAKVEQSVQKVVSINLSAAQINGMYATPVLVLAGISGKAIFVDTVNFDLTGTATQFAGGGVVNVQYDNTANGAGTTCHADIAASVVTGATGLVKTHRISKDLSAIATASIDGKGLYISNKTAAFTTGTGTAVLTVRYHVV